MKKKQIIILASIALIVGIAAFSIVKYTSDYKKAKAELNSYYSTSGEKNYPQYVVISDGVKLRLDPDASAKEVSTLKAGTTVEIIKKSDIVTKVGSKEGYWYNVKFGDKYGWVFEDFLMEKDKVATNLPQNYYSYIKGLSTKDVKSVSLAEDKYRSCTAVITDNNTKDDMFRKFRDLYNAVLKSNQDTFFTEADSAIMQNYFNSQTSKSTENINWNAVLNNLNAGEGIDDQTLKDKLSQLKNNGFRVESEEGGFYVVENPTFMTLTFSNYVSNGIKEFLAIRSNDLKEGYSGDASLIISWNQLSDRIAAWEEYSKKYPSYPETLESKGFLKEYVHTYFYGMDNSSVFDLTRNKTLTEDLQKSYERFMQKYQNSSYYPIVRNYYNMLSNNNFKQTDQSQAFLKSNGLN